MAIEKNVVSENVKKSELPTIATKDRYTIDTVERLDEGKVKVTGSLNIVKTEQVNGDSVKKAIHVQDSFTFISDEKYLVSVATQWAVTRPSADGMEELHSDNGYDLTSVFTPSEGRTAPKRGWKRELCEALSAVFAEMGKNATAEQFMEWSRDGKGDYTAAQFRKGFEEPKNKQLHELYLAAMQRVADSTDSDTDAEELDMDSIFNE